ncbi:CmeU family protein [Campylobacter sp.]|uniref:CmeU family protein n=1 Tax=Campylobacter sp. TaxID=205 RepID=UPI0026DAE6B7|nr:CmeU family protein [Campylobacter sp.]MDO4674079.1 CmeU family protein [Campylobacter sp.]
MDRDKIIENLNALLKQRAEFYAFFDAHLQKLENTDIFDFKAAKDLRAEEVYRQFYHFDYAMRKLLPAIFKAYEINPSKDLSNAL